MANACFTLLNFQPLGKKGFERIHRRAVRHIARRRDAEHVVAEQPAEPEAQAVFDNERDRPDRRAPKGKRILGAGWLFSDDVNVASVSSLSAKLTATVTGAVGTSSPCPTSL